MCISFTTLDVRKLVVDQVEAGDEHDFFYVYLVILQHFGIRIRRWRFIGSVYNIPKIYGCQ